MTHSKLGFQCEGGFPPGAVDRMVDSRVAVAMGTGGFKDLIALKRRLPGIALIARADARPFEYYITGRTVQQAVAFWWAEVGWKFEGRMGGIAGPVNADENVAGAGAYLSGPVEFIGRTPEQWNQFARFEEQRALLLDAMGYRSCIGNFATGTPEAVDWAALEPVLRVSHDLNRSGDVVCVVGFHEYAAGWLGNLYGPNQEDLYRLTDPMLEPPDIEPHYLLGRSDVAWRRAQARGWIEARFALTEVGFDRAGDAQLAPVLARHGITDSLLAWSSPGQRQFAERVFGMGAEALYVQQLTGFLERHLQARPWVLWALVYLWGHQSASWAGYDVAPIAPALLEHIRAFTGGGDADSDDGGETGMTDINLIVERLNSVEQRLSRIEALMLPPEPVYITPTARLNLRAGPGTTYAIRRVLEPGEQLEQLGTQDEWLNVKAARDGLTGWVHRSYTRPFELTRAPAPDRVEAVRPVAQPYLGLHGPADPGMWAWEIAGGGYSVVEAARPEAVKIVAGGDIRGYLVARLREYGVRFVVARLYASVGASTTPAEFLRAVERPMLELYNGGVGWFEVHNEPNLAAEGLGSAWQNAVEFERWYLETLELLRARLPGAKFGLPGMSPNGPDFVTACPEAVRRSDWLGYHVYWGADGTTWQQAVERVNAFALAHPDKPVLVTEFSNPAVNVDKAEKARQYLSFYRASFAPNVHALFAFVSNASYGFEHETWAGSQIPAIIGAR